jgi:hypothetical protein
MVHRRTRLGSALGVPLALCGIPHALAKDVTGATAGTRYATTPLIEPDRCATAWAIQRFVDPAATFEFHAEDAMPPGVVVFDLPEATLRRDARRAALEVLIAAESLEDAFLATLARWIHDIEIRGWARPADDPSIRFERVLGSLLAPAAGPERALDACFAFLDVLRDAASGKPARSR